MKPTRLLQIERELIIPRCVCREIKCVCGYADLLDPATGLIVINAFMFGLPVAVSGTTLLTQSTAGAWSYTHTGYGAQNVTVELWAGGGGGSNSNSGGKTPTLSFGGGGGGGYTLDTYFIATGETISGVVGAAGLGGATNANGTSGGDSTCTQTGQTANGGVRSEVGVGGGAGGGASGGTTNTAGEAGAWSISPTLTYYGGASPNGGARTTTGTSAPGNAPGGGGGIQDGAIGRVVVKAV